MLYLKESRDFPDASVVDSMLPTQGAQGQSLFRELRYHMKCGMFKEKKKKYIYIYDIYDIYMSLSTGIHKYSN